MRKLRINPLVIDDLKAIRDYIAEDNPDMAAKVIKEIYEQFETPKVSGYGCRFGQTGQF